MSVDSLEGLRVVAVDDEVMLLTIVKSILSNHGATVHGATDVKTGMKLVKDVEPHLIVIDRHLKDEDGIALLEQIRAYNKTVKTPVLMLTGERRQDEIKKAISAGTTWYVVKPFQPQMLVDRALCAVNKRKTDSDDDDAFLVS